MIHTLCLCLTNRECSRVALDIQFQQIADDSDDCPKRKFKRAITDSYAALQDFPVKALFLSLNSVTVNLWNHPTLIALMSGEDIESDTGLYWSFVDNSEKCSGCKFIQNRIFIATRVVSFYKNQRQVCDFV